MALLGLTMMGLGINVYIKTNVGVGAWDVFHSGLAQYIPQLHLGDLTINMTIGRWIIVIGTLVVLTSQILSRNLSYLLCIITGFVVGMITDLWEVILRVTGFNDIILTNLLTRWIFFILALIFLGSGIALLVRSKLPPTPVDTLMLGLMDRFHLKYNPAKFIVELFAFCLALGLNLIYGDLFNNIGLGTLIALLGIGFIVQYADRIWDKLFGSQK